MISFKLEGEYIELIKLLKACNIAESGGMAKKLVEDKKVSYNDKIELRKRCKVRKGDVIKIGDVQIKVV